MDRLTPDKRSWNMGRIRSGDTKPEKIVRSLLHKQGYRFRLHRKDLPGTPDITLPRYSSVIMVHGCFWHRHKNCQYSYTPKSRVGFWKDKFEKNVLRDKKVIKQLKKKGWKVKIVWECQTKNEDTLVKTVHSFLRKSRGIGSSVS